MTSTLLGAASLLQKFAEEFAGLPVLSYSINTANEIPHCLMFQSYFKSLSEAITLKHKLYKLAGVTHAIVSKVHISNSAAPLKFDHLFKEIQSCNCSKSKNKKKKTTSNYCKAALCFPVSMKTQLTARNIKFQNFLKCFILPCRGTEN